MKIVCTIDHIQVSVIMSVIRHLVVGHMFTDAVIENWMLNSLIFISCYPYVPMLVSC